MVMPVRLVRSLFAPARHSLTTRPGAIAGLLVLVLALSALPVLPGGRAPAAAAAVVGGLHVAGNQLVDGAGQPVVLRGVNRSGTEYACVQGWGIFDGPNPTSDDASIPPIRAWGSNAVNIGLNEDCWLGINGVPAAYGGANYQDAIAHYVQTIEANGMYPILSLFWSAPGSQK